MKKQEKGSTNTNLKGDKTMSSKRQEKRRQERNENKITETLKSKYVKPGVKKITNAEKIRIQKKIIEEFKNKTAPELAQ